MDPSKSGFHKKSEKEMKRNKKKEERKDRERGVDRQRGERKRDKKSKIIFFIKREEELDIKWGWL